MATHHQLRIILRHLWFITVSPFIIEQRNLFTISLWSHIVITMMDAVIMIEVGVAKVVSIMAGVVVMVIEVTGVTEAAMKAATAVIARL